MGYRFDQLHPEDKFSPEERKRIDDFWHTAESEFFYQGPKEHGHRVLSVDTLRSHVPDNLVVAITVVKDEHALLSVLPAAFRKDTVFFEDYWPIIKSVWQRMNNIQE